jgi:hypothetical protein
MKRRKDSEPSHTAGNRPPAYVIVVAAGDRSKEHYPADRFNLWDALHAGEDHHRDPEPDQEAELEAEP